MANGAGEGRAVGVSHTRWGVVSMTQASLIFLLGEGEAVGAQDVRRVCNEDLASDRIQKVGSSGTSP